MGKVASVRYEDAEGGVGRLGGHVLIGIGERLARGREEEGIAIRGILGSSRAPGVEVEMARGQLRLTLGEDAAAVGIDLRGAHDGVWQALSAKASKSKVDAAARGVDTQGIARGAEQQAAMLAVHGARAT